MVLRALQLAASNGDILYMALMSVPLIGCFIVPIVAMIWNHYEAKELKKQRLQEKELRLARIRLRASNYLWGLVYGIHKD